MTKIREINISYNPSKDSTENKLYLGREDKINTVRLYKKYNLNTEETEKISLQFILQRERLIRHYIKEADILLKVGGIMEIVLVDNNAHSKYLRSIAQVKYEFAISTNGRYSLVDSVIKEGILTLKYKKNIAILIKDDSISKWTFGIISNGQNNSWVKELVNSICVQKIPNYEILICGPIPYDEKEDYDYSRIKIMNDIILKEDIRAPISHKKNSIIRNAAFNNICIMHDRYLLPSDWYENFLKYGNYFDALCLKTISLDGARFGVDWMKYYYPLSRRYSINRPLLYTEWHEEAIIPGGVIIIKKNIIESFLLDERLHWNELEDMQLSKIAYLNGVLIDIDPNNYFIARQVRHTPQSNNHFHIKFFGKYLFLRGVIGNILRFRRITKAYYRTN